jgi:hypothetical protein
MFKNFQRQNGNALVIVIIALVVVLIGVLGFVAWNKFLKPAPSTAKVQGNMITYTPPVVFSLSTDTNATAAKLVGAPASFKSYIIDTFYQDSAAVQPDCSRVITIKQIYKQKYATSSETVKGGPTCTGTELGIYGIVDGVWKGLASTERSSFICQDLEQYKIPSAIAGTKCLDPSTDPSNSMNYIYTTRSYSQS